MRNAGGYITIIGPDPLFEQDTFTCIHCNCIVRVEPGFSTTDFVWCRKCMKPVCEKERCQVRCLPWDQQMEINEARGKLRRQMDEALRR